MNDQIRTQEEAVTAVEKWAEQYGDLKFLHEIQMWNLKESFKSESDELHQELKEAFVSKQLIEYIRRDYDNKLKLNEIDNQQIAKSDNELPEILFASIMRSMSANISNSSQFYKDTYLDAKELILKYYVRYFEMKTITRELKESQAKELKELVEEIKDDSVAFYMVTDIYSDVRKNLRTKDKSPREYECYTQIYNNVKYKMIGNMERIRKETLIDYTALIEVQITREEALERIDYIQTQIESENFGVLKEEWINSEDRYFAIDIKSKANKISRTLDYYKEKYNKFNLIEDTNLKRIMDLPGIRLKKNHTYNIKI